MNTPTPIVQAVPAPKKKRAPVYDVYRLQEFNTVEVRKDGEPELGWVCIDHDVPAATDKLAIAQASDLLAEDERYGQFFAVLAGTIKVRTRGKRVVEQDVVE